mmetsp:Transcript_47885/g.119718  ORF Transcript_47885/g.119718 Transcript_47885/m.119718 type:complete len:480 (+) Transcript_47885:507-1946(+)
MVIATLCAASLVPGVLVGCVAVKVGVGRVLQPPNQLLDGQEAILAREAAANVAHRCLHPCPRLLWILILIPLALPSLVQDQLPQPAHHLRQIQIPRLHIPPRRRRLAHLHRDVVAVKLARPLKDLLQRQQLLVEPVQQRLRAVAARERLRLLHARGERHLDVGNVGVLIDQARLRVVVEGPPVELGGLGRLPEPVDPVLQGGAHPAVLQLDAPGVGLLQAHLARLRILSPLIVQVAELLGEARETQELDEELLGGADLCEERQPPEDGPQVSYVGALEHRTVHAIHGRLCPLWPCGLAVEAFGRQREVEHPGKRPLGVSLGEPCEDVAIQVRLSARNLDLLREALEEDLKGAHVLPQVEEAVAEPLEVIKGEIHGDLEVVLPRLDQTPLKRLAAALLCLLGLHQAPLCPHLGPLKGLEHVGAQRLNVPDQSLPLARNARPLVRRGVGGVGGGGGSRLLDEAEDEGEELLLQHLVLPWAA